MEEIFERISWEFEDGRFEVECCIRRSALARRIYLKVPEPKRVILTLPKRIPEKGEGFSDEKWGMDSGTVEAITKTKNLGRIF